MNRVSKLPQWPPSLPLIHRWMRWQILAKLLIALSATAVLTTILSLNLDYYQHGLRQEPLRIGIPAPYDIYAVRQINNWQESAPKSNEVPANYTLDLAIAHTQLDTLFLQTRNYVTNDATNPLPDMKFSQQDLAVLRELDNKSWDQMQDAGNRCIDSLQDSLTANGLTRAAISQRISDFSATITAENDPVRAIFSRIVSRAVAPSLRQITPGSENTTLKRTIRAHEVIIPAGRIITNTDLKQLKALGLLKQATFARIPPLAGLLLFAILALGIYLRYAVRPIYDNNRKLLLLAALIIMPIWVVITLGGENERMIGLIAVPAAAMAIAGLLGHPVAIASTMLIAICASLPARNPFVLVVLSIGSALAGMMVLSYIWPTSRSLPAVLTLIAVNLLLLLSMASMMPDVGSPTLLKQLGDLSLVAAISAVGASIVAVGSIYILARPFGITTHYRLMELSNPNEALLRKMMHEAPGSYHSSVMVANIAEAAADAIGADSLLTRVAALYHDIGKLKRPSFFIENQAPLGLENVHKGLAPKLSFLILTSHVKEGIDVAREYKLPEEIIQIIREHHGTTMAAYFYHRAINEAGDQHVNEHDFRYPGPKPSTREAAIVMIADSVQASVKSLKEPTPGRIENMVNDIINNRLNDGQLENCDITLRDIRQLSIVLVKILTGLYTYTRIEYPDIKGEGSRKRAHVNTEAAPRTSEPTNIASSS